MFTRRSALASGALAATALGATALAVPLHALAQQGKKDSVTLALVLEPPGLDPTAGAASSIAEVTLYNIYETLTKINADGSVSPRWPRAGKSRPTSRPTPSSCAAASPSTTTSPSTPRPSSSPWTARAPPRAPTRTSAPSPT